MSQPHQNPSLYASSEESARRKLPISLSEVAEPGHENGNDSQRSHQFHCAQCNASFKRSEHLKRHQTQHTKMKAYSCQYCGKQFARSDVLQRHYTSCKAAKASGAIADTTAGHAKRACSPCRNSKVKCSGKGPVCDRCKSAGLDNLCSVRHLLKRARPQLRTQSFSSSSLGSPLVEAPQITTPTQQITTKNISAGSGFDRFRVVEQQSPTTMESVSAPLVESGLFEHRQSQPYHPEIGISTTANLSSAGMPPVSPNQSSGVPADQNCDTYFTLDALDYSMMDTLFNSQNSDFGIDYSSTNWSIDNQCTTSLEDSNYSMGDDLHIPNQRADLLPRGMNVMQVSPLETHRIRILEHLRDIGQCNRERLAWLSVDNVNLFLWSYFAHCHHHTPFLHLPSWNIGTASTRLVFALLLMGAMYSGDLQFHGSHSRKLCYLAEEYAWTTDPAHESGGSYMLDTIQAVYLLNMLDAFFFRSHRHKPDLDVKRLMNAARSARLFDKTTYTRDLNAASWLQWSLNQSRLRTAFILYLFEAIRAVLFGQSPELRLYEVQLPLPSHESTFAASDEASWMLALHSSVKLTELDYPLILSAVLSNQALGHDLNFSVMGNFIMLHGILLYLWERQQILPPDPQRTNTIAASDQALREHLATAHQDTISKALRFWRMHWNKTLESPDSASSSGLYRDRAIMYWVLATIVSQPRFMGATKVSPLSNSNSSIWTLRVPRLVKKLVSMLEQDPMQLETADWIADFPAIEDDEPEPQGGSDAEHMDTISINFLLRKRNQTVG